MNIAKQKREFDHTAAGTIFFPRGAFEEFTLKVPFVELFVIENDH